MQPGFFKRLGVVLFWVAETVGGTLLAHYLMFLHDINDREFSGWAAAWFVGTSGGALALLALLLLSIGVVSLYQYLAYGTTDTDRIEALKSNRERDRRKAIEAEEARKQEVIRKAAEIKRQKEQDTEYVKALEYLNEEIKPRVQPLFRE